MEFESEECSISDALVLDQISLPNDDYSVHQTLANLVKKLPISETSAEQTFSRHKFVHSRLRPSLGVEKLNESPFVWNNFETVLKIARLEKETFEIENRI